MASITSPGIGSGLDIQGLVSKLVAAEGQPVSNRLDRKEARLQAELSAFGSLKGALSSFQSALSGLTGIASFDKRTASPSNTDLYTATASSAAVAASYQVEIQQLAESHKLASQAFTDTTTAIGTGTLTFQFGDPTKAAQTVTIADADNSLTGIRDAVNAANIGVRASIVQGDSGYQLVFSSANTGTDNSLKITVSESPANGTDTDMNGLSQLAYDPAAAVGSGKNLTEKAAAKDAVVVIDGITVTRSSNTISDAIEGVTLSLKKAELGTSTSLKVDVDKSSVTAGINMFVAEYNKLVNIFKALGGYDATAKQGGILLGDSALRGVRSQISALLGNVVPGLSNGQYRALVDLGIKTQSDGTLTLDSATLETALTNNYADVGRLFAAAGKSSDSLVTYDSATSSTQAGEYAVNITQLATQGTYSDAASAVGSLLVDATNDTFAIKVDGISSGTITLSQKTYASATDLAAELQSKINGDSALQAAGVTVTVAYDGGTNRFTFTSDRYGSASAVEIASVEDVVASGNIGLTANAAAATAGVDVAGTIGGFSATGSGQYLTGTSDAAGLKLKIAGASLGSRGSVVFSRGVADQLDTLLGKFLASDGFLTSRTESLTKQVDDITSQREALSRRLDALQTRYMAQFTALDTLMSQMQSTSNYLANQLSSLPGGASSSSK